MTAVAVVQPAWPVTPPAQVRAAVEQMSATGLAVALYASDMPTTAGRGRDCGTAQIGAWAAQGLMRLGPAEILTRSDRSRRATDASGTGPAFDAIWPRFARCQAAHDLAYRYLAAGRELAVTR